MGTTAPVTSAPSAVTITPSPPRAGIIAHLARWPLIATVAATFVAFLARVWALGDASLWYDEGYSLAAAAKSLGGLFATIVPADNNPPLHYLLLHLAMPLAGTGEFAVRFVSLVPGVLMVPLAYATATEALRGWSDRAEAALVAGVPAALLVGLSPYLIFYSQEARMYSQLACFGLAALWTLLWATRDEPDAPAGVRPWLAHGVTIAAMLYSHYAGVLLLPALAVYAALGGWRTLRRWLLALAAGLLLWLPWLPSALAQVRRFGAVPEYFPAQLRFSDVLGKTLSEFLGFASLPLVWAVASLLLVAAVLAITRAWQRDTRLGRRVALPVLAALLPIVATAALATVIPKFVPRYAIVAAPALLVVAPVVLAVLLWNVQRAGRVVYGSLLGVALLVSLGGAWSAAHAPWLPKDDARTIGRYLTERVKAEQVVLHVRNTPEGFDYYYHGAAPRFALDVGFDFEAGAAKLNQVLASQPEHVWLVLWQNEFTDPTGMVITELTRRSEKPPLIRDNFSGYHLMRFELDDWSPVVGAPTPAQRVDASYEDQLTLVGADPLDEGTGAPGWILYWQAAQPLDRDYSVTVQLVDEAGAVRATHNQAPVTPYLAATGFPVGVPLRGLTQLKLPTEMSPGVYEARLLVWDARAQRNLGATSADGRPLGAAVSLGRLEIKPAESR